MPFGDRTGPSGQGPRTGRHAGFCAGAGAPGSRNPGSGCGWGRGRGGRGRRNRFYATGLTGWQRTAAANAAPVAPDAPGTAAARGDHRLAALLKSAIGRIDAALADIRKRLQGLEAGNKPE
jgi:hypothetical protein